MKYTAEAKIFKIMMHPARLAILELLRGGEECVCHLEAVLGFRQAYISQHLTLMKEVGLVEDRREGWNSYYRVIHPELFEIIELAMQMSGTARLPIAQFNDLVQTNSTCGCPKCKVSA